MPPLTGNIICCKPHRYDPHESEVMQNMVVQLNKNGVVEEKYGPWGALVVLYEKIHQ